MEINDEQQLSKIFDLIRLQEKADAIQSKIETLEESVGSLHEKSGEFEVRINNLEYLETKQRDTWATVTRYILQTAWIILLAWALAKLNLAAPPFN